MEGRPWLRILCVLAGFVLLAWPVWSVTHSSAALAPAPAQHAMAAENLHVQVTFAQPPRSFALTFLGQTLCTQDSPGRTFTYDWKVAVPKEGVDLLVKAAWLPETPSTAVRVEISRGETTLADQTFWAQGSLVDTVTVPGGQP